MAARTIIGARYFFYSLFGSLLFFWAALRIALPYFNSAVANDFGHAAGVWLWVWIAVAIAGAHMINLARQREQAMLRSPQGLSTAQRIFLWASTVLGYLLFAAAVPVLAHVYNPFDYQLLPIGDISSGAANFALFFSLVYGGMIANSAWSLLALTRRSGEPAMLNRLQTASYRLQAKLERLAVPDADVVIAKDTRRPILFLRSFDDEAHTGSLGGSLAFSLQAYTNLQGFYPFPFNEGHLRRLLRGSYRRSLSPYSMRDTHDEQLVFSQVMNLVGPYIAIGRPDELLFDMDIGAAKKYVSDDDWQQTILQWIERSAAIVLEAGTSMGFTWEVEQVVRLASPTKVLLLLPWRQDHYDAFLANTFHIFPRALPTARPPSRLMTFRQDWQPRVLTRPDGDISLEGALLPFFQQNSLEIAR